MLLLGAWQGERISLLAVTQHPPSALETELAASTLMATTTLRFIDELMLDLPQFHLLPSAACSSSRLLPTSNVACIPRAKQLHNQGGRGQQQPRLLPTTSATRTLWSPTLRATSPLLHPHLMLLLGAWQGDHTTLLA